MNSFLILDSSKNKIINMMYDFNFIGILILRLQLHIISNEFNVLINVKLNFICVM